MFKKISKVSFVAALLFVVSGFTVVSPVLAADPFSGGVGVCSFIGPICDAIGIKNDSGTSTSSIVQNFVKDRLSLIISLVFIAIILISVFIIIRAAITYIQSQGEEGKIAEAQKAIKSVFIGIGVLFVGIVGLVLVLAFFNGTGLLSPGGTSGGGSSSCGFDANGIFVCGSASPSN